MLTKLGTVFFVFTVATKPIPLIAKFLVDFSLDTAGLLPTATLQIKLQKAIGATINTKKRVSNLVSILLN